MAEMFVLARDELAGGLSKTLTSPLACKLLALRGLRSEGRHRQQACGLAIVVPVMLWNMCMPITRHPCPPFGGGLATLPPGVLQEAPPPKPTREIM